jgi:iron(III) transport system ATP-binding protein
MRAHPEGPPAIEVRGLSKRFGSVTAVDNVSFRVEPGELFFLLGPSGCGKTTMLRILAGIESPDSGTVLFGGRDVSTAPPHLRGAPMVFQNYALWPHLSVRDNVAFGLVERRAPRSEIRERVARTLGRVGLRGLEERMPGQLSGGQQQRVVLARALVLNPDVVLLDEPLSNLDAKLRLEMREEIERLHRETDITFVYVTHDQAEALSLADRLSVMNDGRIEAVGTPAQLYHRPPSLFCADFLGEANLVPGRVAGPHELGVTVHTPFGPWQAVCPDNCTPTAGMPVTCLVRPENLRRTGAPDNANTLTAETVSVRLSGSTMSVVLAAEGMELKATLLNEYPSSVDAGTRMRWYADVAGTIMIPEPGEPEHGKE